MPQMNFTHFRGAVPRFQNYAAVAEQGVLFITPEANVLPRRYDPFEDSEGLLLDVVRAGAAVAGCDTFMDYCLSHKMLPLRDAEFWRDGDFFTARPDGAQPLLDTILAFVRRYGLPVWEQNTIVTTSYPARYEQRAMAVHFGEDDGGNDLVYLAHYEAVKRACSRSGAVPECTLALMLLNFYLQFIEGMDAGHFFIRNAEWALDFEHNKTPELRAQVYDLTTGVNLAYAQLVSGEGKTVRQCNHCQKFFIADDWRAEYCSPRCRGAYNSKMTRKRVKERKEREQAKI